MESKGINYVVLGSQRADVGQAVRPFCRLTRMDDQAVRTLLTTHGPRLFRAYIRRSDAQGFANQLRAFGLSATMVSNEDIIEYVYIKAQQVNIGLGGISAFVAKGEAPTFVPFADVAAIVQGKVSEIVGREKVMAPRPGEPKMRTTYTSVLTVDVHRRSVPVAVRFTQPEFHMNPIVAGEPIEGPTDLPRFVTLLRDKCKLALFDDSFARATDALDFSLRMLDAGESVAIPPRSPDDESTPGPPRLPVADDRQPEELSESPAFDLYSMLWRYQAIAG